MYEAGGPTPCSSESVGSGVWLRVDYSNAIKTRDKHERGTSLRRDEGTLQATTGLTHGALKKVRGGLLDLLLGFHG